MTSAGATPFAAAQQGPRPLPLFLAMVREHTAQDPARRAAALAGLAAYQGAERAPSPTPKPVVAQVGAACLRDYGGAGPAVVFVPSLINPARVLDLSPERSLLRWIAAQGFRTYLVDWGTPGGAERGLDVAGHVAERLLPLLATLEEAPSLVGYCLGGTMALAAAARRRVRAVATIAAPWHFTGYGAARADMARLWAEARPACAALGLVPMEVLQAGFWQLDPARTVDKYAAFASLPPHGEAARSFVALEDWANAGAPLTYAAGAELFEQLVGEDLPGRGEWQVAGAAVRLDEIGCPAIEFVSTLDRLVPAAASANLGERRDLAAGHVGMVVGRKARSLLWEPLAAWLRATAG